MSRKPFSLLLVLALLVLLFTSGLNAQELEGPVTVNELVSELIAISMLLDKAQIEYLIVSDQLKTVSATLAIVSTEEIPLLKRQITDSKHLFNDYRAETAETIRKLRIGLFALGAGLVISFFIGLIV